MPSQLLSFSRHDSGTASGASDMQPGADDVSNRSPTSMFDLRHGTDDNNIVSVSSGGGGAGVINAGYEGRLSSPSTQYCSVTALADILCCPSFSP